MPPMPAPKSQTHRPPSVAFFQNADELLDRFDAYVAFCVDPENGIKVGTKGRTIDRPLTMSGFAAHAGTSTGTLDRASRRPDLADAFAVIRTRIEAALHQGGLTRAYDSNIVARITKLSDKTTVEHEEPEKVAEYDYTLLDDDELEQLTTLLTKCTVSPID